MSEFKFACPVCGQHITADARASGKHLECPTCFQKIVVPQAPASPDSKLILSATQVAKPRPASDGAGPLTPLRRPLLVRLAPPALGLLLVAVAAGAAVFAYKKHLFSLGTSQANPTNSHPKLAVDAPRPSYPVPTNFTWALELTNVAFPESAPEGRIHGNGFHCDRVTLQGGNLTFRQGKGWPPDLALTLLLFARQAEELNGKTLEVSADRAPPLPRLVLRWKNEQNHPDKEEFLSGYALRLVFGQAAKGRMPGQIYVCLPDESKSFMAGTFSAEIHRPPAPKIPKPKAPPKVAVQNPK